MSTYNLTPLGIKGGGRIVTGRVPKIDETSARTLQVPSAFAYRLIGFVCPFACTAGGSNRDMLVSVFYQSLRLSGSATGNLLVPSFNGSVIGSLSDLPGYRAGSLCLMPLVDVLCPAGGYIQWEILNSNDDETWGQLDYLAEAYPPE